MVHDIIERGEEYLVILGRSPDLSYAELLSFLEARGEEYDLVQKEHDFSILKISNKDFAQDVTRSVGSILKIAQKIICIPLIKEEMTSLEKELSQLKLLDMSDDHFNWGVSGYGDSPYLRLIWQKVKNQIKKEIKMVKGKGNFIWPRKAHDKPFEKRFCIPLMPDDIIKKRLIDQGFEINITLSNNLCCLWRTIGVLPLHDFNERDFKRPHQRPIYSISPALARTMINLSKARKSDIILDPFCGVGTILQEALLSGFNVKGLDINSTCINQTVDNLYWTSQKYDLDYSKKNLEKDVQIGDARSIEKIFPKRSIHAIVSEPDLGPPLRIFPSKDKANRILTQTENLYTQFITSAKKVLLNEGKMVLTFPIIRIQEGGFLRLLNLKKIVGHAGFFVSGGPYQIRPDGDDLHRSRKRIIEREIYVLNKRKPQGKLN